MNAVILEEQTEAAPDKENITSNKKSTEPPLSDTFLKVSKKLGRVEEINQDWGNVQC